MGGTFWLLLPLNTSHEQASGADSEFPAAVETGLLNYPYIKTDCEFERQTSYCKAPML
ncbi:MAG: hypothetical protein R3193_16920 [Marinobacter sp.]|nr:hypothetical protein [Marinobacter sp.]